MEENEALLGKEPNLFSQKGHSSSHRCNEINFGESRGSSSDESIGWLAESQSSCNTSCSGIDSFCRLGGSS